MDKRGVRGLQVSLFLLIALATFVFSQEILSNDSASASVSENLSADTADNLSVIVQENVSANDYVSESASENLSSENLSVVAQENVSVDEPAVLVSNESAVNATILAEPVVADVVVQDEQTSESSTDVAPLPTRSQANSNSFSSKIDPAAMDKLQGSEEVSVLIVLKEEPASRGAQSGIQDKLVSVRRAQDKFKAGIASRSSQSGQGRQSVSVSHEFMSFPVVSVRVTREGLASLDQNPDVLRVSVPQVRKTQLVDSIPLMNFNYAQNRTSNCTPMRGRNQAICVIDTGIDYNHPAFANKIIGGYDFVNEDNNATDDNAGTFHGTHVSGIAAGNASPVLGAAPDAYIIPVKVCNSAGSCSDLDMLQGIDYCNVNATTFSNVSVISASIGGDCFNGTASLICTSTTCPQDLSFTAFDAAFNASRDAGIIPVFASGNDGYTTGISFPGCLPNAISVGSTTKADAISGFSNRGGGFPAVWATGTSITSADFGGGTRTLDGTSMATPHVSGLITLIQHNELLQGRSKLNLSAMASLLNSTGRQISGIGRINALAALGQANVNFTVNTCDNSTSNSTSGTTITYGVPIDFANITQCAFMGTNIAGINDSSNCATYNRSATITFVNLSGPMVPLLNGSACPPSVCTNVTFGRGVLSFQVTGFSNYSSVAGCSENINESSRLNQSVNASGSCFNITEDNVELDCNGFTIDFATSENGTAINMTGRSNVTVKNCIILNQNASVDDADGFLISDTNNSFIQNVSLNLTTSGTGVFLTSSHGNTVENSTILSNLSNAVVWSGGNGNVFRRDVIVTNSTTISFIVTSGNSGVLEHSILSAGGGVYSISGAGHIMNNNSFSGGSFVALTLASNNNVVSNSTIRSSASTALSLGGSAGNNTIMDASVSGVIGVQVSGVGNTFVRTNSSSQADRAFIFLGVNNSASQMLFSSDSGTALRFDGENNSVSNATIRSNATWIRATVGANNLSNVSFDAINGSIFFVNVTVPVSEVGQSNLSIGFNRSLVNSSALSFLNTSAQLTLHNLAFTNPRPLVDFEDDGTFALCSASQCVEDSYNGSTFVFNVSSFTSYSTQESPVCPLNITTSTTLGENVTCPGTAINMLANNVALDCAGFTVNYSTAQTGVGINMSGRNNVTVKNCVVFQDNVSVAGAHGILFSGTANSLVQNNSVTSITGNGIRLSSGGDDGNVLLNNTASGDEGIVIVFPVATGNSLINNTGMGTGFNGISTAADNAVLMGNIGIGEITGILVSGDNNILTNNAGTGMGSFSIGILLSGFNHTFVNNRGIGNGSLATGIQLFDGLDLIANNTGLSTDGAGFSAGTSQSRFENNVGISIAGTGFGVASSVGNNFTNTTGVSNTSIGLVIISSSGNIFNGTLLLSNNSWLESFFSNPHNMTNTTFENANGSIRVVNRTEIPGDEAIGTSNLNITFNKAFLNSTNLTFFNTSAQITLHDLAFTDPRVRVDFEDAGSFAVCNAPQCVEDSYNGSTFVFNVSSFTSYAAQESPFCPLNITTSTTLTENVTCSATAINILADNIALDCKGFTINYSNSQNGKGINVTGRNNVTVKNCIVVQGNSSTSSSDAILLSGTTNSNVFNVTVNTTGSLSSGVLVSSGSANTIENSTGASNSSFTFYLTSGTLINLVRLNQVINSGASTSAQGITVGVISVRNIIENNVVSTSAGVGISLDDSNNNTVVNNTITSVSGTGLVVGASNNTIANNSITSDSERGIRFSNADENFLMNNNGSSVSNSGISIESGSNNNTLSGNRGNSSSGVGINFASSFGNVMTSSVAVSDTNAGLELASSSGNNTFIGNNASSTSNFGLRIQSNGNVFRGNRGISSSGAGIVLIVASLNSLINDTGVSTSGIGVSVQTSHNNSFFNVSGFSSSNFGIDFNSGGDNNLTNSTGQSNSQYGIRLFGSIRNRIVESRATSSSEGGIYLTSDADNNILINNTFASDTAGAVEFGANGGSDNDFRNTTLQSNRSWIFIQDTPSTGNNFTNTLFDNATGSIRIIGNFTMPGGVSINLTQLNISLNHSFVNTTNLSFLNQSGQVTLRNLPFTSTQILIDRDDADLFELCPEPECVLVSNAGGTHVFNVTHFTAFEINQSGLSILLTKIDSIDPVNVSGNLTYQITVNVTSGNAFNITINESYPGQVTVLTSQPAASSGNNIFSIGNLTENQTFTVNITVRVDGSLENGTLINNTANVTFENSTGTIFSVQVIEQTTVLNEFANVSVTKVANTSLVPRGTQFNYTINITSTGNVPAQNIVVQETYPAGVTFIESSPVPSTPNGTFTVGTLSPGQEFLINISVNLSSGANGTVLNNSVVVNFTNSTNDLASQSTSAVITVLGSPLVNFTKTESLDPVLRGSLLNYTIIVNNTGDDYAFNVTVLDFYSSNVTFVSAQPSPTTPNGTFEVGNLAPNQTFRINITVLVNDSLTNGSIINNTANLTFQNVSNDADLLTTEQLTTVVAGPAFVTNKTGDASVIKSNTMNYTINVTNTGEGYAFNVSVIETYPSGTSFVSGSPSPTGSNNTFAVGMLAPGQSFLVNITVSTSTSLVNGSTLNNSYVVNATTSLGNSTNETNSTTTLVIGFPLLTVTKTDSSDPVTPGTSLTYTITITNSGDDTAFNVTVDDSLSGGVTFNGSSPAPSSGNTTFLIGNLSPGQSTTINISVNLTAGFTGTLNNTVNVTFANTSGQPLSVNASQQTTVATQVFGGGGGGGGGAGGASGTASVSSMSGNTMTSSYLKQNDKVKFIIDNVEHTLTVVQVLADRASFRVASVPQDFTIAKKAVQLVDVDFDGVHDLKVEIVDIAYSKVRIYLEKLARPAPAEVKAPESKPEPASEPAPVSQPSSELAPSVELAPEPSVAKQPWNKGVIAASVLVILVLGAVAFFVLRKSEGKPPSQSLQDPLTRAKELEQKFKTLKQELGESKKMEDKFLKRK